MNAGVQIRTLIQGALDIPEGAKQGIIALLEQLPEAYKQRLFQLIRAATAAGVGAVVSSFITGLGGPGAIAGLALQARISYATPDQLQFRPYL
jgi:hypothetical protein